jgi:hypothetical protein
MPTDKLGGRRFVLAVLAILVTTALVAFGKVTPSVFENVTIWTVGAYIAGNSLESVGLKLK